MSTRACDSCRATLPALSSFCPMCGVRLASRPALTLDDILGRWQIHMGHDYRRCDRGEQGQTLAVYGLGIFETALRAILELLPGYEAREISRRPGMGDPSDWLRVDLVPRQ